MPFATASTIDELLPGVVAAVDAVDAGLVATALAVTRGRVRDATTWGDDQAYAHAHLALHWLSTSGTLAAANVEDPGESGTVRKRSDASTTYEFDALAIRAGDVLLASSRWGRRYLEIWQRHRPVAAVPMVIR